MEEKAVVVEVKGRSARLEIERNSACKTCQACSSGQGRAMFIMVKNEVGAKKGDRVNLEINSTSVLRGAFLIYLLPSLGLILGTLLTSQVTGSVVMEALGSIAGFTISIILVCFYLRKIELKGSFIPRITRILD
jgi:sigma-E factor negative regulatory protein RseC